MNVKPSIQSLKPYQTKQHDAAIHLHANETTNYLFPNGLSLNIPFQIYPNSNADPLREALGRRYNLPKDNFIIGNGSTELLELCVKSFSEQGDTLLTFDPSFSMYDIYAQIHQTTLRKVKAKDDVIQDMEELIAVATTVQPRIIFLCTPNNPTGFMNTKDDIIKLLESTNALVIVDEAYMDFTDETESVLPEINQYPNLIVARTFSKAYGLAALRLGYMVANPTIVNILLKVKLPYSVNTYSMMAGIEALQQSQKVTTFLQEVMENREQLYMQLQQFPLSVFPSKGNFLYVKTEIPLQKRLLEKGILIRALSNNAYRITVGTQTVNNQLIQAIQEVLYENK